MSMKPPVKGVSSPSPTTVVCGECPESTATNPEKEEEPVEVERGQNFQEQIGMPEEEDMRNWSHHFNTDTCDDPIFRAAMKGYDTVSFVFGLEVTWDLITARKQEEEEQRALDELAKLEEALAAGKGDDSDSDSDDDDVDDGMEKPFVACDAKEKEKAKAKPKEPNEKRKKKAAVDEEDSDDEGDDGPNDMGDFLVGDDEEEEGDFEGGEEEGGENIDEEEEEEEEEEGDIDDMVDEEQEEQEQEELESGGNGGGEDDDDSEETKEDKKKAKAEKKKLKEERKRLKKEKKRLKEEEKSLKAKRPIAKEDEEDDDMFDEDPNDGLKAGENAKGGNLFLEEEEEEEEEASMGHDALDLGPTDGEGNDDVKATAFFTTPGKPPLPPKKEQAAIVMRLSPPSSPTRSRESISPPKKRPRVGIQVKLSASPHSTDEATGMEVEPQAPPSPGVPPPQGRPSIGGETERGVMRRAKIESVASCLMLLYTIRKPIARRFTPRLTLFHDSLCSSQRRLFTRTRR